MLPDKEQKQDESMPKSASPLAVGRYLYTSIPLFCMGMYHWRMPLNVLTFLTSVTGCGVPCESCRTSHRNPAPGGVYCTLYFQGGTASHILWSKTQDWRLTSSLRKFALVCRHNPALSASGSTNKPSLKPDDIHCIHLPRSNII